MERKKNFQTRLCIIFVHRKCKISEETLHALQHSRASNALEYVAPSSRTRYHHDHPPPVLLSRTEIFSGAWFSFGSRRGTGIYPRTVIPVISPTNVTLQILSGHRAPWFVASSHWRSRWWIVNTGTRPILQRFHRFSPGPFFSPSNRIQISRAVIFLSSISLFLYLFSFYTSRDVDC